MHRRDFLGKAALTALATGGVLTGCGVPQGTEFSAPDTGRRFHWRMVTAWPHDSPGLGGGAQLLARMLHELSEGRIQVRIFAADDLVSPFKIFGAVSRGAAEIGHGAAHYWQGKSGAAQFFTAVPFGMDALETQAWLHEGGGLELWRDLYRPFDVIPFPCGNTGAQMGGWFQHDIQTLADLQGLPIRAAGLGGEVLRRAGAQVIHLPGDDLPEAMAAGQLAAAEWMGPYEDMALGLHRQAPYYYHPGWQAPGFQVEALINRDAYEVLPQHLQVAVAQACRLAGEQMLQTFLARNQQTLDRLVSEHGVQLKRFPTPVLDKLRRLTQDLLVAMAEDDPFIRRVHAAYMGFQSDMVRWKEINAI
ncbi:TRAP-type mannitol/chloroaromatic compound transport system, substrate-binding protein [Ectothiorhodospira magna]|uniref:TRAP-type mannitol/chloroaromatic compound transport system, substrate-binding protein n=1 Tax=Ectothiorhodospira magna TaxID=867345 RepID=A0A1H9BAH8_9GAMM|nr:TRAP transporter substrate-binding protein [Ectothiorhodospira magna]SEP85835.1 TRAP-type mannitol/chloroaromatic compound transport system, substrate-binding protein [Ectothiorhodospira magna]